MESYKKNAVKVQGMSVGKVKVGLEKCYGGKAMGIFFFFFEQK